MNQNKKAQRAKPTGRARRIALTTLALAASALLGYQIGRDSAPVAAVSAPPAATPAAAFQSDEATRERAYAQDAEALTALAQNALLEKETREEAARRLADMTQRRQRERALTQAIEEAGFAPCMALEQNGSVTILLQQNELTAEESAALLALCMAHMPVARENVRIMTGET